MQDKSGQIEAAGENTACLLLLLCQQNPKMYSTCYGYAAAIQQKWNFESRSGMSLDIRYDRPYSYVSWRIHIWDPGVFIPTRSIQKVYIQLSCCRKCAIQMKFPFHI